MNLPFDLESQLQKDCVVNFGFYWRKTYLTEADMIIVTSDADIKDQKFVMALLILEAENAP